MLLWIRGCLTPQEIRERITHKNSDFLKRIVEYLENLCVGQFLDGTKDMVSLRVAEETNKPTYKDPTKTLPVPPPPPCDVHQQKIENCKLCSNLLSWRLEFINRVDDILLRSNIHNHNRYKNKSPPCIDSNGNCKRRFPRETFYESLCNKESSLLS